MTLTKEDVDARWKEIEEFERVIPGIRYGEDYPPFALAVVGSAAFDSLVAGATMLGLLTSLLAPKKSELQPDTDAGAKAWMEDMKRSSPLREAMLRALYLGYKLGKTT